MPDFRPRKRRSARRHWLDGLFGDHDHGFAYERDDRIDLDDRAEIRSGEGPQRAGAPHTGLNLV